METTANFLNSLCFWDLERFSDVLKAYTELNDYPVIMEDWVWCNSSSGYVYIALENGVTICEAFNWIEYLVTNFDNWEEFFFDTYQEALDKISTF